MNRSLELIAKSNDIKRRENSEIEIRTTDSESESDNCSHCVIMKLISQFVSLLALLCVNHILCAHSQSSGNSIIVIQLNK